MGLQLLQRIEGRSAEEARATWNETRALLAELEAAPGHGWFLETPQSSLFPLLFGDVKVTAGRARTPCQAPLVPR